MSDQNPLVIHAAADGHLHMLSPLVICDGEVDWPEIEGIQATDDRAYLRARYVHGGLPANGNGHIFRTEHLVTAHRALPHTYLNWLHRSNHTVGCFTATRLVDEATGVVLDRRSEYTDTPYVEALAAMWRLAYPDEYRAVRLTRPITPVRRVAPPMSGRGTPRTPTAITSISAWRLGGWRTPLLLVARWWCRHPGRAGRTQPSLA